MGDVFEAFQVSVRRRVAAKCLKPAFLHHDDIRRRFEDEAILLARLNSPHIVSIFYYDSAHLAFFMEFLNGRALDAILRDLQDGQQQAVPLPVKRAVDIVAQVLLALDVAHSAGIVHRDVKPGNIFVAENGHVKLTDFGIAKIVGRENLEATRVGIGSPMYMAPEQILGQDIDGRADIYATGTVLYALLTGQRAFSGRTYEEIIVKQISERLVPPHEINPAIPLALNDIVLKATQKKPDDRFQTASEFRNALLSVTAAPHGEPVRSRRRPIATYLVVLTGFTFVGGLSAFALWPSAQATGRIEVVASEAAEVYLDGVRLGIAPMMLPSVAIGERRIKLVQPGFMEIERTVMVKREETALVEAVFPTFGNVRVIAPEAGTSVLIDGSKRVAAPATIKLPIGRHHFTLPNQPEKVFYVTEGEEAVIGEVGGEKL